MPNTNVFLCCLLITGCANIMSMHVDTLSNNARIGPDVVFLFILFTNLKCIDTQTNRVWQVQIMTQSILCCNIYYFLFFRCRDCQRRWQHHVCILSMHLLVTPCILLTIWEVSRVPMPPSIFICVVRFHGLSPWSNLFVCTGFAQQSVSRT